MPTTVWVSLNPAEDVDARVRRDGIDPGPHGELAAAYAQNAIVAITSAVCTAAPGATVSITLDRDAPFRLAVDSGTLSDYPLVEWAAVDARDAAMDAAVAEVGA